MQRVTLLIINTQYFLPLGLGDTAAPRGAYPVNTVKSTTKNTACVLTSQVQLDQQSQ
ncbi:MAG: hypothetical protein ACI81A_003011 [Paraglaciecola sp.]|jgi:hypothetical protein